MRTDRQKMFARRRSFNKNNRFPNGTPKCRTCGKKMPEQEWENNAARHTQCLLDAGEPVFVEVSTL